MSRPRQALRPRPLDRQSPTPLWAQLHADLLRRLEVGAFEDAFPGEIELQETYEVSRHTVREALRRIRDAGLVDFGRGRPTKVKPVAIEQPLGGLYSLFREVEAQGIEQISTVLDIAIVRDPAAAVHLDLEPDVALFQLERIRLADGEPLAHDIVWLPERLGRPLLDADFSHAALYDELRARTGRRPTGGTERITAIVPTPRMRSLLRLPRGQACIRLERTGCVNGRPIEYRLTTVRADRYALLMSWSPNGYVVGASSSRPRRKPARRGVTAAPAADQ